ncbi:MAG: S8 family serine peptidase [Firmicutes bacterium]|nr:S8 family serine peptidase [Bacillota bacterium]
MITKIRKIRRWLAIMMVFFLLFPAGSYAEDVVYPGDQSIETAIQDNSSTAINEEPGQGNETPAEIQTLDAVPAVNINENLDQQIIIIYKDSGEDNVKNLALTDEEVVSGEQVSNRVDLIEVSEDTNIEALMAEMEQNPNVLTVDKNDKIEVTALPNDPYIVSGAAWQFQRVGADQTWDQVNNAAPVVVAVIDTGLNVNHPDLIGNIVAGYDFVTGKPNVIDLAGHGTAVSGTIAAVANNGIGGAGISGLANIKIAPYRTGGAYSGDTQLDVAYICAALLKAAERPEVKVINMSFGGYGTFSSLAVAVNEAVNAGKIVVASSGNEGESWNARVGQYSYPASYDHVISVGAINKNNVRASFSQYNDRVDLSAPGQSVLTTSRSGGYEYASGTSFSSPIVAGACAVLVAADPSLNAQEVEAILKSTALDLGAAGSDPYYGSGLIQLNTAVASINSNQKTGITYRTHVQNVGWQGWRSDGQSSGTSGQSLRLEGIEIKTDKLTYNLGIEYQTHVQNIGWQGFRSDGQTSGTYGQSLRLEAIQIRLTGPDAPNYDVYYRVHSQNYGWLDWAKNGANSGTQGKGLRLEAIEIKIVPKEDAPPGSTNRPFII